MGTSGRLATSLDAMFFAKNRVRIDAYLTGTTRPKPKSGTRVARELRSRLLLRYITEAQADSTRGGVSHEVYATPTVYSPEEAASWLITPASKDPRPFAILLDPAAIEWVIGPMWVGPVAGIQYILPEGYPEAAIVVPGA